MTKQILIIVLISWSINSFSQIGINNSNPDSSSILDITATDRGVLIPRMSTAIREGMLIPPKPVPANGLLVFDSTLNTFYFYDNNRAKWLALNPWLSEGGNSDIYYNESGNIGIGNNNPTEKLDVSGNIKTSGTVISTAITTSNISASADITANKFIGNGTIPLGGIILWSGAIADIPSGWQLCDGSNDSPNLRDRFIVGAGSSYSPDNTGGLSSVKLTSAQSGMPIHGHGNNFNINYGATNIGLRTATSNSGDMNRVLEGAKNNFSGSNNGVIADPTHKHSMSGGVINATAQDAAQSHENRPPYYALAFIIRVL